MSDDGRQRDVERFVESFAAALVDAGIPRMPARVFARLLATDSGRLTAAELSDQLIASPAAISGAVRYLAQVNLVSRVREPGSRRDHYVVQDDIWYRATIRQDQILDRWIVILVDGIAALGRTSPAAGRLAESRAFFEFLREELPAMMGRWEDQKDRLTAAQR